MRIITVNKNNAQLVVSCQAHRMIRKHLLSLLVLSTIANITNSDKQFLNTIIKWSDGLHREVLGEQGVGGKDRVGGDHGDHGDQVCVADYEDHVLDGCNKSLEVLYTVESEWLTVENKGNQAVWKVHLIMGGTLVFKNTEIELIIVTVDDHTEAYGRIIKKSDFYEAGVIGLETVGRDKFIIPKIRFDDKMNISSDINMNDEKHESFYKFAMLTVKDKRLEERMKYLRKEDSNNVTSLITHIRTFVMSDGRSPYSYLKTDLFQSIPDLFISTKILPNFPENCSLDCTNIFHTQPEESAGRAVFTAYPGSGNTWVR